MGRHVLLIVTALGEGRTGASLLMLPTLLVHLLLGVDSAPVETLFVGRLAGAALLAIGVICWLSRRDDHGPGHRGLLIGVLLYDIAAAGLRAYGGLVLAMNGILLWPAVALHVALAVWCVACLRYNPHHPSARAGGHHSP